MQLAWLQPGKPLSLWADFQPVSDLPPPSLPSIYGFVTIFLKKKGMLVMTSSHITVQWSVTCNWQCKEKGKAWVDWKVIGPTKEVSAFSQSKFPNLLKIPSHTHTHTQIAVPITTLQGSSTCQKLWLGWPVLYWDDYFLSECDLSGF